MSIDYPYPQVHMVDWMEGVEWERERIIELLEDFYAGDLWRQVGSNAYVGFDMSELIALIKGEK